MGNQSVFIQVFKNVWEDCEGRKRGGVGGGAGGGDTVPGIDPRGHYYKGTSIYSTFRAPLHATPPKTNKLTNSSKTIHGYFC